MPLNRASSRAWAFRVNVLAASPLVTATGRVRRLRRAGMTIGNRADFRAHCWFFSDQLVVGDEVLVSYGCSIENREPVTIGARTRLASQVSIVTSSHVIGGPERRASETYDGRPVTMGEGCWIGARAVILPGVTLGAGCIVAAGAVVTAGEYEPDRVYGGVPAELIRELGEVSVGHLAHGRRGSSRAE